MVHFADAGDGVGRRRTAQEVDGEARVDREEFLSLVASRPRPAITRRRLSSIGRVITAAAREAEAARADELAGPRYLRSERAVTRRGAALDGLRDLASEAFPFAIACDSYRISKLVDSYDPDLRERREAAEREEQLRRRKGAGGMRARTVFGIDKVEQGTFYTKQELGKWLRHVGFDLGRWPRGRLDTLWEEVERRKATLQRLDGTVYRCVQAVRLWVLPTAPGSTGHLVKLDKLGGGGAISSAGASAGGAGGAGGTGRRDHASTRDRRGSREAPPAPAPPAHSAGDDGGGGDATPWMWMHDGEPPTHAAIRWALDQLSVFTSEQGEGAIHLDLESLREGVTTYPSADYPKLMTLHRLCQISLTIDGLPSVPFTTTDGLLKNTQVRWEWRPLSMV